MLWLRAAYSYSSQRLTASCCRPCLAFLCSKVQPKVRRNGRGGWSKQEVSAAAGEHRELEVSCRRQHKATAAWLLRQQGKRPCRPHTCMPGLPPPYFRMTCCAAWWLSMEPRTGRRLVREETCSVLSLVCGCC